MDITAKIDPRIQVTDDGAILFAADSLAAAGADHFDPAWFDAEHWLALGRVVAMGAGRGGVVRVSHSHGDWVLRHYRRGGMVARVLGDRYLWNGAERTRGFMEFRLLTQLARRGLTVPLPIAARYRRVGVHYRADLITHYIDGARTLADHLRDGALDTTIAARVGAAIGEFHAAGVYHADLNANNILIDAQRVWLLDFDRGALRPPARSWQVANLARLRRSLIKLGAARDGEQAFDRDCWRPLAQAWERSLGGLSAQATGGARG